MGRIRAKNMLIKDLIKRVHALPDSWVKVEGVWKIPTGLELCIAVHKGRRGRKVDAWRIKCLGVREFQIADVDGGGLKIYPTTHPAARQYVVPQASLRWTGDNNVIETLGAICYAHTGAVDDWIPMDCYMVAGVKSGKKVCRGPVFLMRAYSKALRGIGAKVLLASRKTNRQARIARPRVLHFGSSSVVADKFTVEPSAKDLKQ